MDSLRAWAVEWGNLASIAGFAITLLGFALALRGIRRSRSAAEAAQRASEHVRGALRTYDAIVDLAAAMAMMDEIKRHQRNGAWQVLPDRYSQLRQRLIAIGGLGGTLTPDQRQTLEAAIDQFGTLERRIDRAVASGVAPPNPSKLNEIVNTHLDAVQIVLQSLRSTGGGPTHE